MTSFTITLLYLDQESPSGTTTDFAIAFNMTHFGVQNESSGVSPLDVGFRIPSSQDYGIFVYAPEQALTGLHWESNTQGRSFVDSNFVVRLASTVGYAVFAGLVSGTMTFGATALALLAGGQALATLFEYTDGQQLPQSGEAQYNATYLRLWDDGYLLIPEYDIPPIIHPPGVRGSRSDIMFMQMHSGDGNHCGALKIVIVNELCFTDWGTYPIGATYRAKLATTFIVPYFVHY
jgi:hypothetical protein